MKDILINYRHRAKGGNSSRIRSNNEEQNQSTCPYCGKPKGNK